MAFRVVAALLLVGAASPSRVSGGLPEEPPQVARSRDGMVATADPRATDAGVRMLERGGNAVDAAVAAGFALAVVHPAMTGLGGRAVALVRTRDGSVHGIDGMVEAPEAYDPSKVSETRYGYRTIGVPGTVAAYARLLREFGTLPLTDVLAPAIGLAERGFPLRFGTATDHLSEFEGSRNYFLKPDGSPYRVGERLVQRDLARTLRILAEQGPDAFYRGEIARQMARDISANGGYVREEDLARYEARPLRIVRGEYRGYELVGSGRPPSGYMVIEALQIMDQFRSLRAGTAEWMAVVGQAIALAVEDRETLPGPQIVKERRMVSRQHAVERASLVRLGSASTGTRSGDDGDAHTTHLSTADRNGMVVALTQSLGPSFGSKVATPGLGFLYAATLGGYKGPIEPGERASLNQTPLLVLERGRPRLVLGAAGGKRIPSSIVNVVGRVLGQGLSLPDAVAAPRVHPGGEGFELDKAAGVVDELAQLGFETAIVTQPAARVHAVAFDAVSGEWIGAADPRGRGSARGPRSADAGGATFAEGAASASGWKCSEFEGRISEYVRGGRYLVTLRYAADRAGTPVRLVISDADFPRRPGEQIVVTRDAADLQQHSGPQEHWPNTSRQENTAYTAAGLRRGEDEIDDVSLVSFIVNANPTTETLEHGEQREGLLEIRYRGGRVRRDLNCSYRAE